MWFALTPSIPPNTIPPWLEYIHFLENILDLTYTYPSSRVASLQIYIILSVFIERVSLATLIQDFMDHWLFVDKFDFN